MIVNHKIMGSFGREKQGRHRRRWVEETEEDIKLINIKIMENNLQTPEKWK